MAPFKKLLFLTSIALTTWAKCPAIPSDPLATNPKLPDPFTFAGGQKVVTAEDWACRRAEILQLFQTYESGALPPKPETVTGSLSEDTLTVNVSNGDQSISFSASVTFPSDSTDAVPAILNIGSFVTNIPAPSGVAIIRFNNDDIAQQSNTGSRGMGKFYTLYGADHSASSMTAWAWGISRLIDVLESSGQTRIDTKRLAVTGCSRNGKGAFTVGALEPRIALTIPQESGSGGAACWRISDALKEEGHNVQTAHQIVTENVWFSPAFNDYVDRVNDLPIDHHMLAALIAPRGLYVIEHSAIDWLGPQSAFGCQVVGRKIYQALGVLDHMGVSSVTDHSHCQFPSTQGSELDAFINKFLKGDADADTNIQRTDQPDNLGFVESDWVDWEVPTIS